MMCGEAALRTYLDKWDNKYWTTYKVLDILQKLFYRSNPGAQAVLLLRAPCQCPGRCSIGMQYWFGACKPFLLLGVLSNTWLL